MKFAKRIQKNWQRQTAAMAVALATTLCGGNAFAMPDLGANGSKSADVEIKNAASQMDITAPDKAVINWNSFSIAQGETVNFIQPDASAVVLNNVIGNEASAINGAMNANGRVFLVNPNGILFGADSSVNVGGLVASTQAIDMEKYLQGTYVFSGSSEKSVINEGKIKAEGGVVVLHALDVENKGTITVHDGTAALAGGTGMTIDYMGDGKINLAVTNSHEGAVLSNKVLTGSGSDKGRYLVMTVRDAAKSLNSVVNQVGIIEAGSLQSVNGEIILAGDTVSVASNASTTAKDIDVFANQKLTIDENLTAARNINLTGLYSVTTKSLTATTGNVFIDSAEGNNNLQGNIVVNGDITAGMNIGIADRLNTPLYGTRQTARDITVNGNMTAGQGALVIGAYGYDNPSTWSAKSFSVSGKMSGMIVYVQTRLNIDVHDIYARDWVQLGAYGGSAYWNGAVGTDTGRITLNGTIQADGTNDNTAVVIGTNGQVVNNAGADAIKLKEGSYWKIYAASPFDGVAAVKATGVKATTFGTEEKGYLKSGQDAIWNDAFGYGNSYWNGSTGATVYNPTTDAGNRYIFAYRPTITITALDASKTEGTESTGSGVTYSNSLAGYDFHGAFNDATDTLLNSTSSRFVNTGVVSNGFAVGAAAGMYSIDVDTAGLQKYESVHGSGTYDLYYAQQSGYRIVTKAGQLRVSAKEDSFSKERNLAEEQMKATNENYLSTSNLDGTGSYKVDTRNRRTGVDRVAGLTSAELPFFKSQNQQVSNYGTYSVVERPSRVELTPTAKNLPEPQDRADQYRELDTKIAAADGEGNFRMVYDGSRLAVHPLDAQSQELLVKGDAGHNEAVLAQALHASFNEMGLVLEDVDAVYLYMDK